MCAKRKLTETLMVHLYLFVLSDHEQNHKLPPPLSYDFMVGALE